LEAIMGSIMTTTAITATTEATITTMVVLIESSATILLAEAMHPPAHLLPDPAVQRP
jgi:hypothetical protein